MVDWPHATAISRCIEWNENEHGRAVRESSEKNLKVPTHATKIVKGEKVSLTVEEFRESRAKDAARFLRNVAHLRRLPI